MDTGTVSVLNVGQGHITLTFDKSDPTERIRAARIVHDMLRRGYALLVEVDSPDGKRYQRVHDFDEQTCEYVIADLDPDAPYQPTMRATHDKDRPEEKAPTVRKRGRKKRIAAEGASAVAVAPSAGG